MMSKAAFMMQEHLRRHYVMITDVSQPNTFFVRGRLPFPQGLLAIAVLFKNKRPADVYAHPYFIEKQSDPSQPSPQLHLTEESQGIIKTMSGLRYMRDDQSKLDNTMVFVTDYKVEVEGRMPTVPNTSETAGFGPIVATAQDNDETSLNLTSAAPKLNLEQRALHRRTMHHVSQIPGGGGSGGLGLGGLRSPVEARTVSARAGAVQGGFSAPSPSIPGPAGGNRDAVAMEAPSVTPGYSTFPTPEDCANDAWTTFRYLKAAIYGRRALQDEESNTPTHRIDAAALFEKRGGGYTVLYNPIEVNEKTFVEMLLKLQQEERVVKAIVVPTRPAWRHLQVWADVFPDAELICSGEVPLVRTSSVPLMPRSNFHTRNATGDEDDNRWRGAEDKTQPGERFGQGSAASGVPSAKSLSSTIAATDAGRWKGGCVDMGNGLTGLSFPEVDWEAEAAMERQYMEAAAAKAKATSEAALQDRENSADPQGRSSKRYRQLVQNDQGSEAREMTEHVEALATMTGNVCSTAEEEVADSHQQRKAPACDESDHDPVDVLWSDTTFFVEWSTAEIGLREGEAWRLRILAPRTASPSSLPPPEVVRLTSSIELLHISGDAVTEEYVLYDATSRCLACTDLFHGKYADYDPANSWMSRVWFKFMKRGDHKRTDVVPRYKWLQVLRQHSLPVLQAALDELTRLRPIDFVIFAHGTPPNSGSDAVDLLRKQWRLPPLHPAERPTKSSNR